MSECHVLAGEPLLSNNKNFILIRQADGETLPQWLDEAWERDESIFDVLASHRKKFDVGFFVAKQAVVQLLVHQPYIHSEFRLRASYGGWRKVRIEDDDMTAQSFCRDSAAMSCGNLHVSPDLLVFRHGRLPIFDIYPLSKRRAALGSVIFGALS